MHSFLLHGPTHLHPTTKMTTQYTVHIKCVPSGSDVTTATVPRPINSTHSPLHILHLISYCHFSCQIWYCMLIWSLSSLCSIYLGQEVIDVPSWLSFLYELYLFCYPLTFTFCIWCKPYLPQVLFRGAVFSSFLLLCGNPPRAQLKWTAVTTKTMPILRCTGFINIKGKYWGALCSLSRVECLTMGNIAKINMKLLKIKQRVDCSVLKTWNQTTVACTSVLWVGTVQNMHSIT